MLAFHSPGALEDLADGHLRVLHEAQLHRRPDAASTGSRATGPAWVRDRRAADPRAGPRGVLRRRARHRGRGAARRRAAPAGARAAAGGACAELERAGAGRGAAAGVRGRRAAARARARAVPRTTRATRSARHGARRRVPRRPSRRARSAAAASWPRGCASSRSRPPTRRRSSRAPASTRSSPRSRASRPRTADRRARAACRVEAAVLAAAAGSEPARATGSTEAATSAWRSRGDDLLAAGLSGPAVGRALQAARAALLDGSAPDATLSSRRLCASPEQGARARRSRVGEPSRSPPSAASTSGRRRRRAGSRVRSAATSVMPARSRDRLAGPPGRRLTAQGCIAMNRHPAHHERDAQHLLRAAAGRIRRCRSRSPSPGAARRAARRSRAAGAPSPAGRRRRGSPRTRRRRPTPARDRDRVVERRQRVPAGQRRDDDERGEHRRGEAVEPARPAPRGG